MQEKGKYDLIVIDSLDGCNDSNPYEENRREYALPLKKLARRNDIDFPACSIVVLHHNNRNGNFREPVPSAQRLMKPGTCRSSTV